mgnify:CR=1 FL=1
MKKKLFTVALALISGFLSTLLGTLLAFCASYLGKAVDEVLTVIANLFIIVPETVVIMFVAVFAAGHCLFLLAPGV